MHEQSTPKQQEDGKDRQEKNSLPREEAKEEDEQERQQQESKRAALVQKRSESEIDGYQTYEQQSESGYGQESFGSEIRQNFENIQSVKSMVPINGAQDRDTMKPAEPNYSLTPVLIQASTTFLLPEIEEYPGAITVNSNSMNAEVSVSSTDAMYMENSSASTQQDSTLQTKGLTNLNGE